MDFQDLSQKTIESLDCIGAEVARRNKEFTGTEDILLGIILHGDNVAATVLRNLGLAFASALVAEVEKLSPKESLTELAHCRPMTSEAETMMEVAVKKAKDSGSEKVEPEHILLAIIQFEGSIAVAALQNLGFCISHIREELQVLLGMEPPTSDDDCEHFRHQCFTVRVGTRPDQEIVQELEQELNKRGRKGYLYLNAVLVRGYLIVTTVKEE